MFINTNILSLLVAAIALALLGSCRHGEHALCNPEYDTDHAGYLSAELMWDEYDDILSPIDDVRLTIADGGNVLKNKQFTTPLAVAEYVQQLPSGNYDALAAVNMSEARGYLLTTDNTKNTVNNLPVTCVSLKDPLAKHTQSWFAVANATVSDGSLTVAQLSLKRLLASLSVTIKGAPDGTTADIAILHTAQSVNLATATPSTDESAQNPVAMLPVERLLLMPTAAAQPRTMLILNIATPGGTPQQCTLDAPRMDIGKIYSMELEYNDLDVYLYITSTPITDWEEYWTISGEIFNPD